jgi:hypothetical protein
MGCLVQQTGSLMWSWEELVISYHHSHIQGKSESYNWALWSTAFLLEVCWFQLTTSFSKVVEGFVFQLRRLDQLIVLLHPHQAEVKFSHYLFGHQLCPVRVLFFLKLGWTMWFPPELMMCCIHWGCCSYTWCNWVSFQMDQAGINTRFSDCELWPVQDVPDACTSHSAVLCFTFFQKKRRAK